jgi:hypothetical protein
MKLRTLITLIQIGITQTSLSLSVDSQILLAANTSMQIISTISENKLCSNSHALHTFTSIYLTNIQRVQETKR